MNTVFDLRELEYVSGICRATLLRHIRRYWLQACQKDNGIWYIDYDALAVYLDAQWRRHRLLMNLPQTSKNRMDDVIEQQGRKRQQKRPASRK